MASISPPLMNLTWPLWKAQWKEVLATATLAAGLEAGAFALFLCMFAPSVGRVLPIVGGSLLLCLIFHVGISALHAYLISHPAVTHAGEPIAPAE